MSAVVHSRAIGMQEEDSCVRNVMLTDSIAQDEPLYQMVRRDALTFTPSRS